jgi:hypothetical protein
MKRFGEAISASATDYIGFDAMSRVVRNLTEGKHRGISFL